MTILKAQYGAVQDFTVTLDSLADGDARASALVDNTTDLFDDVLIYIKLSATFVTPSHYWSIGAYGSLDGTNIFGREYGMDGTDVGFSIVDETNFTNNGSFNINVINAASSTFQTTLSQLLAFGYYSNNQQVIPPYWGIIVFNSSSVNLDSSGHLAKYMGYYAQAT